MSNFRLKVFYSVAKHLNFSKAAESLFISQPAVTKNIKELETQLDVKLFDRISGKVRLTKAGLIVLKYAESVLGLEQQLLFDIGSMKDRYSGQLRIGASTTIGQYVLPAILARFHQKYPDVALSLLNDNTEKIENALLKKDIDIAIVEGASKNSQIKYIPFLKDEIVAIAHTSQALSRKEEISIEELKHIPLLLREEGSGSLEVITNKLKKHKVKPIELNIVMHMGSTEGIKSYLRHSNSLGLISVNAVSKEIYNNEFKIIDIRGLEIDRLFYFIHPHGKLSGLAELFLTFSQQSITKSYRP